MSDIQTTINNLHVIIVLLALSTMIIDNSWKDLIISMGTDYFWYIWINKQCGV